MSLNEKDYIRKIAEDVKENPDLSLKLLKRFLPLLIVLFLASLLWLYFTKSEYTTSAQSLESIESSAAKTDSVILDAEGKAATEIWAKTLGGNIELNLPNGSKLIIPEKGFEKSLLSFLSQDCPGDLKASWFNCDRLLFKTGSVELNTASLDQVEDIANLMKAFPNSKFKIGGYTDNTGDALVNVKLSQDRASQVMLALVDKGVPAASISSEGYGPEFPVCPANDTEECKAKNRRVAIRIEKCK